MNILKEKIAYNSSGGITRMLLERLNGFDADQDNDMVCREQLKGRVEYIGSSNHHRLFFLLEGKIYLKGAFLGRILLDKREFILLPPHCEISCATLLSSNYVILGCTGLQTDGNVSFMEELRNIPFREKPQNTSLPIREKLGRVLKSFFAYLTDDSHYPAVYDAVLMLMRSFYTAGELATLFFPLLHENETVGEI